MTTGERVYREVLADTGDEDLAAEAAAMVEAAEAAMEAMA